MERQKWDIFISHSHEDKWFVETLANILVSMGLKVWYDSFVLELGDSLSKKINEGLANSTYGIVVLSHSFFKKDWTQLEVAALLNKEINKCIQMNRDNSFNLHSTCTLEIELFMTKSFN
ncbi:MAG: toll/interleukin-1 receptor domain-containing protein, partial [Flavobacterium sp.]